MFTIDEMSNVAWTEGETEKQEVGNEFMEKLHTIKRVTFGDLLEMVSNVDGLQTAEKPNTNGYGSLEFFVMDGKRKLFEVYYDGRDERTPKRIKLCVNSQVFTDALNVPSYGKYSNVKYTYHKSWNFKHCYSFYYKTNDFSVSATQCYAMICDYMRALSEMQRETVTKSESATA